MLGAAETRRRRCSSRSRSSASAANVDNGANIQVLSVKAPKGAKITVKCSGKGCPRKSVATATKVTRISQFQRVLPAGIRLRITIAKPGYISKVTTISIRKGKAPLRSDQCQVPGEKEAPALLGTGSRPYARFWRPPITTWRHPATGHGPPAHFRSPCSASQHRRPPAIARMSDHRC